MQFTIYCDGSARNNGKANAVGSWAYVILNDKEEILTQGCEVVKGATNQQMELMAAAEALEYLFYNEICVPFDSIKICTDSAYLHNCVKQKWYVNWQNNGWKNTKKEPVANRDLWERLVQYFEMPEVEFVKVKGHATNKWNNYVDELAQTASNKLKEEQNNENCNY
jgi:ribonuclease HI